MSLLQQVRRLSPEAASVLERIAFHSDADIMSLDRTDLHEILPGPDNLRVRKAIFGMIDRQVKLQNTHGGNLVTVYEKRCKLPIVSIGNPKPPPHEVKYWLVVKGPVVDASQQLMKQVMDPYRDSVHFVKNQGDHKVTVLLCPIVSRIMPDVAAAMGGITDNKPVILVVMHHAFEPKAAFKGKWDDYPNIVLQVNIFHHVSKSGLLKCSENTDAICEIQKALLSYAVQKS